DRVPRPGADHSHSLAPRPPAPTTTFELATDASCTGIARGGIVRQGLKDGLVDTRTNYGDQQIPPQLWLPLSARQFLARGRRERPPPHARQGGRHVRGRPPELRLDLGPMKSSSA